MASLHGDNWKALFRLALALPKAYQNALVHCEYDYADDCIRVEALAADGEHIVLTDAVDGFPSERLVAQLLLVLPNDTRTTQTS